MIYLLEVNHLRNVNYCPDRPVWKYTLSSECAYHWGNVKYCPDRPVCKYTLSSECASSSTLSKVIQNPFRIGSGADTSLSNALHIRRSSTNMLISCARGAYRCHHARTKSIFFLRIKGWMWRFAGFSAVEHVCHFRCSRAFTKKYNVFFFHFGVHIASQNDSKID